MTVRVAFVHDHLVQRGGSERVLVSMLQAFPKAPVFTAFYRPETTYPELRDADVRCLSLDRIPGLRRHHRAAFPAFPFFFSRQRVDADVVICNSSGWAQGVQATGPKIVYFHALARWLHTPLHDVAGRSVARQAAIAAFRRSVLGWDRKTVLSADRHLVAGLAMRKRVWDIYGVHADVLTPPVSFRREGPSVAVDSVAPGFFLAAARLVPYKNLDAVVAAFARLPDERLVVAGEGPDGRRLRDAAPPNVVFVGAAADAKLRWLYTNCRALVCAGFEPYGITPVEAAAFGKPTLALREGGLVDVVVEGETGEFFARPEAPAIADAARRIDAGRYDPTEFQRVLDRHSEASFTVGLRAIVDEELDRAGKPLTR
jgi:glycosyltransferase involved in cell wall biosynthesis